MQNYSIKINLQKMQNVFIRKFKGRSATKTCICIPVEDNPSLFIGEKGCYLNIDAYENTSTQYGDTHYLKGNLPREVYDKMNEDERRSQPIIGNMRPLVSKQEQTAGTTDMSASEDEKQDDLPF